MSAAEKFVLLSVADEIELEQAELDRQPVPESSIERDGWFEYRLYRMKQLREQQAHNAAICQMTTQRERQRIADAEQWRDDQNATLQSQIDWIERHVRDQVHGYVFPKDKKSRVLPSGKFGMRAVGGGIDITDMAAAVVFAREHEIPVKEEVTKTALKEYIASTGAVLPFVEVNAKIDQPYVEVAK